MIVDQGSIHIISTGTIQLLKCFEMLIAGTDVVDYVSTPKRTLPESFQIKPCDYTEVV